MPKRTRTSAMKSRNDIVVGLAFLRRRNASLRRSRAPLSGKKRTFPSQPHSHASEKSASDWEPGTAPLAKRVSEEQPRIAALDECIPQGQPRVAARDERAPQGQPGVAAPDECIFREEQNHALSHTCAPPPKKVAPFVAKPPFSRPPSIGGRRRGNGAAPGNGSWLE